MSKTDKIEVTNDAETVKETNTVEVITNSNITNDSTIDVKVENSVESKPDSKDQHFDDKVAQMTENLEVESNGGIAPNIITIPKPVYKEISLVNRDIFEGQPYNQQLEMLKLCVESGTFSGATTLAQAFTLFARARLLNLPVLSASEHMFISKNGKTGVDIHVITALLLKAGIEWKTTHRYVPLYKYMDGNKYQYTTQTLPSNAYIVSASISADEKLKAKNDGKHLVSILPGPPIDYYTCVEFRRHTLMSDNKVRERIVKGEFLCSTAVNAGLIKDGSAWAKYTNRLCFVRAFTEGAREIASDILLGLYERSELYDLDNKSYDLDVNENVIIQD